MSKWWEQEITGDTFKNLFKKTPKKSVKTKTTSKGNVIGGDWIVSGNTKGTSVVGGRVILNGKSYAANGKSVKIVNNRIWIDGREVTRSSYRKPKKESIFDFDDFMALVPTILIILSSIVAIILVVVGVSWTLKNVDGPFKEGSITAITIQPERNSLDIDRHSVYRSEYRTQVETYIDSNGKTQTRTVRKLVDVFDHYEYRTILKTDNEDYILTLQTTSKKDPGYRERTFYVSEEIFKESQIGDHLTDLKLLKRIDWNNDTRVLQTSLTSPGELELQQVRERLIEQGTSAESFQRTEDN